MSKSTIASDIKELEAINSEISRLTKKLRELRKRSRELESTVGNFIVARDKPGVKLGNTAIIVEKKERRKRKKTKDQKTDMLSVLRDAGVSNPEETLKKMEEAKKGVVVEETKVKMKEIPMYGEMF